MEIHLFIVWSEATQYKEKILKDIKQKFLLLEEVEVTWTKKLFSENLSRFYGENLPKKSQKEKHCGSDSFHCFVVKDVNPNYCIRETSKGFRVVNVNCFDLKQLYRKWSGGGHKIHATDNEFESQIQLALLFGKSIESYKQTLDIDFNHKIFNGDLIGANGWKNFDELFNLLNITLKYVVLRNYKNIEEQLSSLHPDIDLLVENKKLAITLLNAKKTFNKDYRVQYNVRVLNKDINFDLRHVGDNYYDYKWQRNILNTRVLFNEKFYIPNNENLCYSLLYHALYHKKYISQDYFFEIINSSQELLEPLKLSDLQDFKINEVMMKYLLLKDYNIVEPHDLSVYFNTSIISQLLYLPISKERKRNQGFLNIKDTIKIKIIKLLKRIKNV